MDIIKPSPDEYAFLQNGIRHLPLGTDWISDGIDELRLRNRGRLGCKLPDGQIYNVDEVDAMARRLWRDYLEGKAH
jgi:hypothetical protein